MKSIDNQLLALDREFWTGDEIFYREHVDASCLVAFSTMSGLMDNKDLAATAGEGNRWRDLEIEEKGIVHPTDDTAILTYQAKALRDSGEPYAAIVSSGYVKRANGWKMMFHSHTPIEHVDSGSPGD